MDITKLQITPIFKYKGIPQNKVSIYMKNVDGQQAGEYIKQRLYLKEEIPITNPVTKAQETWNNVVANIEVQRRYSQAQNEIETKLSLYR